ncbi:SMI1/KNR4 family protein [Pseudomonas asiatica]|uniref:SMI1/KNR4 family protein n=1 Tax=Pseudomonas asiatica TaxID=2219225 RepID=UPI002DBC04E8|nr:SMI1/KNR4 family protein [Pseudomonas asiatica]MEB6587841.1 SMI1/KNR4 family protein [Pseudomonas asiatica]
MNDFELFNPGVPVSKLDIDGLESEVGVKLPLEFRELYMSFNGGAPSREFWTEDENYEPIRVEDFKSIACEGALDGDDTKYIGGCFRLMVSRNVLPSHLVPFAVDEAGNFICLDKEGGRVIYFAVDIFQSNVDMCINHINAQKILSSSFRMFIDSLVGEDEIDQ